MAADLNPGGRTSTMTKPPDRPEILLITNHGYAGAEIPIGGAPDTGGQVVYVNALARALAEIGFEVTVMSRGGFPGWDGGPIREGTEPICEHARYLFVPGGGDEFIPKEEISVALDEQAEWIIDHVLERARRRGVEPWDVYELVNTHYWDAAVLGDRLMEHFYRWSQVKKPSLQTFRGRVSRHVWTPHSLGAIKEANFAAKPVEVRRALRFCERRGHERMLADRLRLFASTSPEITDSLCRDYRVLVDAIVDFPPCVDTASFRTYPDDDLDVAYRFLSEHSGIASRDFRWARIVFEASRNDQTKRKDLLVDAFERACADQPDTYLVIGGGPDNGVHQDLLRRQAASPVLRERMVLLLGRIPDEVLYRLFSLAELYVTPSEMEGFGMSAAQAAAAGTALVASDRVPFATQFVPDHAVVVRAGIVDELARAIRGLLDDREDRERRAAALAAATAELAWVPVARRFLDQLRARGLEIAVPTD